MHLIKIIFLYFFLAALSAWVSFQLWLMCRFRKKESIILKEILEDIKEIKKKIELLKK
jgi:hypothetical protein